MTMTTNETVSRERRNERLRSALVALLASARVSRNGGSRRRLGLQPVVENADLSRAELSCSSRGLQLLERQELRRALPDRRFVTTLSRRFDSMRKLSAAALALALVGGVYFTTGEAHASNMGFKLNKSFNYVEGPNQNFYYVSFPYFNGLGDVANESAPFGQPVCQSQDPATFVPDGVITLGDALCDLWVDLPTLPAGARAQLMSAQIIRDTDCGFVGQILQKNAFGTSFVGTGGVQLEPVRTSGLQIQVTQNSATSNDAVIVGSHDPDPSVASISFTRGDVCNRKIINVLYHTMYRNAYEIFCGLETIDWVDADMNGNPDTCTGGIWDGRTLMSIQKYDNSVGAFGFIGSIVNFFFGMATFPGQNIPLVPGEAYLVGWAPDATPNPLTQPHF
jgi:hypothetical protein